MTPMLGDIFQGVSDILAKFIPDANQKVEAQLELAKLADGAEARLDELLQGQIEVDKAEASSGNLFVAGWRPFIGWTCGVSLAYTWVFAPIAKSLFHLGALPALDPSTIYPIVLAMLGIAGMRTYEKTAGVASGSIGSQPQTTPQAPVQNPSIISRVGNWFK